MSKITNVLILIFAFLIPTDCYAQKEYIGSSSKLKLVSTHTIVLQENLQLLGTINDFAIDEDGNSFLLNSQSASIIKYDKEGIQKKIIGKKGKGPFEFVKPSNLSINKDTLLIWDKSLLRLTAMTTKGNHLLQLTDFRNAVAYIKKYNNYVIAYNTGGGFGPLITIYDLSKKAIAKEVGNKTNEHILLMTLKGSGALSLSDGHVLYSLADQPILKRINLRNFEVDSFKVDIPKFEVANINKLPVQIVNNNREKLFGYLYSNSRVNNIFTLDDYIVMEAQTGPIMLKGQNQYKNRKTNFAILNRDLKQIDTIRFSNKNLAGTNLKAASKNSLYILHREIFGGKPQYILDIWEIMPI